MERAATDAPSYSAAGWTEAAGTPGHPPAPAWAQVASHRLFLGQGDDCWVRARRALELGAPFQGPVRLAGAWPAGPLGTPGQTAALLVRPLAPLLGPLTAEAPGLGRSGPWEPCFLLANRVLYRTDTPERFGFGYGTLPAHLLRGEERFLLTRTPGGVHFELLTMSSQAPGWEGWAGAFRAAQRLGAQHYAQALSRALQSPP